MQHPEPPSEASAAPSIPADADAEEPLEKIHHSRPLTKRRGSDEETPLLPKADPDELPLSK